MRKVGSRKFKNRMGHYMNAVKNGQSLLITDRGQPVAKVSSPDVDKDPMESQKARLKELEAQGFLRLAKLPLGTFKAVRIHGKLASEMLLEDRR